MSRLAVPIPALPSVNQGRLASPEVDGRATPAPPYWQWPRSGELCCAEGEQIVGAGPSATGERALADRIESGIPDVLGAARERYG